jgi:hypothetical protein
VAFNNQLMLFITYSSFFLCGLNSGYGDCTFTKEISTILNKIMRNEPNFQNAGNELNLLSDNN